MLFKACASFNTSFLNWKIIIFQCSFGFCCIKAQICLQYTYVSHCAVNHLLLLFHCSTPFLNVSCMISIYFLRRLIIFTLITLNSFSVTLPISSLIMSCVFFYLVSLPATSSTVFTFVYLTMLMVFSSQGAGLYFLLPFCALSG